MTPYLEEHADLLKEDDVVFSSPLRMRPSERVKVSRRKDGLKGQICSWKGCFNQLNFN